MSAVIWLIICGFVIYAALHVLAAIWQFFKSTGKFIGKAVDVSTQNVVIAQVQVKGRIARRIGRAGQDGVSIEVFTPRIPESTPDRFSKAELEDYKRKLQQEIPSVAVPNFSIPVFPSVPDVLVVPKIRFSLGSDSDLDESHIPSLLNGRSNACSVPTEIPRHAKPESLQVPEWDPQDEFPTRPTLIPSKSGSSAPIVLTLPLYQSPEGASRLRRWFVERLNEQVRSVHAARITAFERVKLDMQKEADDLGYQRYASECALAAWKEEKANYEMRQQAHKEAYETSTKHAMCEYEVRRAHFETKFSSASQHLESFWRKVNSKESAAVCRLFDIAIAQIFAPQAFPREWSLEFDSDQGILVVDLRLPDFERIQISRLVALKRETKSKPVGAKEQKQLAETAVCLYVLRGLHELVKHDRCGIVKAIALNGWVEFIDATTGQDRSAVILSIFAEMDQLKSIDISRVDPVKCIASLGGRFAGIQQGYIPIAPIVRLNRHDDRVIEGADILSELAEGTNLAAIDWDKFEHLIRQLFEKVFAGPGIEVKVTRASRDRGVDAIIFDPDPIRGGKTVIQAKRYTNTVDVSAVRDLYGTVVNEGANKGILVTTSTYGPDAYEFSKDKNLTLLTGRELLGLLQKHGYQYRIDLDEARRLHAAASRGWPTR